MDPTQWISASDGKLEVNNHCEALYNILYCIYMHLKAKTNDAFATNTKKVIENDPNAEPCTFAMEYFEEGSDIFELIQRNFLSLCSLGGTNCCKKREESVLSYLLLLEEKLTPKEALEYIKAAFSVENRNLVVGWLKFCKMIELAGRLQREEEIDTDDVNVFASLVGMKVVDLIKNAEACMKGSAEGRSKGQVKFTIMNQLSVMLERGNVVDDDVLAEMATRCNMKKDDLLKGAKAIKEGRVDGRAKALANGNLFGGSEGLAKAQATVGKNRKMSWDEMFAELVKYNEQKGDCNVPNKYEANKSLANWVINQRAQFKLLEEGKHSHMTEDRAKRLTDLGFSWKVSEDDWDRRFNELVEYKRLNGNCNVPRKYDANKQLGGWVSKQRNVLYKKKNKSANDMKRIGKLDDIGFVLKPSTHRG